MKPRRWIILLALTVLLLGAIWLWWMKPTKVDMAAYVPANSLLYIETDRPLAVAETITNTDAWKAFERATGASHSLGNNRLQDLIAWTGFGPIQSVVLARAQIALVVTDLGTIETSNLDVKPKRHTYWPSYF